MEPMDPVPERLRTSPSWLVNQLSLHSRRLIAEEFGKANTPGYHYRLLAALAEFGPASQAELGRRTAIDRSDVVAALNALADQGLVDRSPDPGDRRRNIVTITPAGRRRLTELDAVLANVQDSLMRGLDPDERRLFVRLLTKLLEHH